MSEKSRFDLQMESVNQAEGTDGLPPPRGLNIKLGPNEFEEAFDPNAPAENEPQPAGSEEETEAGGEEGTVPEPSPESTTEEEAGKEPEESFLSKEEQSRFDTKSPAYKAMQASFTRKMQALSEKERALSGREQGLNDRLAAIEARLEGKETEQISPEPVDLFDGLKLSPLPEELTDYDGPITNRVKEVALHVIEQLQTRAEQQQIQQQQNQIRDSLKSQITEMNSDPAYADYPKYYDDMKAIAMENPKLLTRKGGLKVIYQLAKGDVVTVKPAATAANGGDDAYARGVKAGMDQMRAKKTAVVEEPAGTKSRTERVRIKHASLDDAVEAAFHDAVQEVGR